MPEPIPRVEDTSEHDGPCWTRNHRGMIIVKCAHGHLSRLTHEIDEDGEPTDSLICPRGGDKADEGCPWHEHVRLEEWDGETDD